MTDHDTTAVEIAELIGNLAEGLLFAGNATRVQVDPDHVRRLIAEILRLQERVKELETRLEMNVAFQDGKFIEVKPGSIPDGIECRDATIDLLTEQVERLQSDCTAAEARVQALQADAERLDFLDACNAALNANYGTTYRWELILSHNVTRLMLGRDFSVDLHDSVHNGFPSCRDAIDAKRRDRVRAALSTAGDTTGGSHD